MMVLNLNPHELFKIARCHDQNSIAIDMNHLQCFMRQTAPEMGHIHLQTLKDILCKLDNDGDGVINFNDFLKAVTPFSEFEDPGVKH